MAGGKRNDDRKAAGRARDERAMKASAATREGRTRTASTTTGRGARTGSTGTRATASAGRPAQGESGARRNQAIQREAERRQETSGKRGGGEKQKGAKGAVQPTHRTYPENPLPAQHQAKPGREAELEPRPRYEAPQYRGSGKLAGKVALITGADSGIGRAVAVLFAREGADVAVVYLNEHEDAEETRRAVEAEGRRALLIPGDVTDSAFCREAVEQTVRELGKLDILVNNAAFQQHAERLEDITDEQLDRTFRTNIYGYFYMARAALQHLKEGGVILNTGSVTGIEGNKTLLDYSSTKGAIHAFTQSLAQNLVERGIRVNAVAPGPVWTPLNPADAPPEKVQQFGQSVPMKRPAQPEELAPAYVFLASSVDSSYITGDILPVLGGKTVG
ncbi:MAG TPA: SDR family oxidoreductase [Gemmatimonadaceae bacterium]|nr:SDR family oxidoreductase [Gemmatimonadaceae bacterium]